MNNKNQPVVVTVGTYPPYEDGISTFTNDLTRAQKLLFEPGVEYKVAAIDITGIKPKDYPKEVEWVVRKNERADYAKVALAMNKDERIKCVILQHEYGLFGTSIGEWTGDFILDFTEKLEKPLVVIFHTVLPKPPKEVEEVTRKIIKKASKLVVMSEHSSITLEELYGVEKEKIKVIPHGVHPTFFEYPEQAKKREGLENKLIMATFGFLGPGKGIEYVIESLPEVVERYPNAEYWLIGRTHPLVQAQHGEKYRKELESLVAKLNLKNNVKFFNRYQSLQEILKFLSMTDIYIATSLAPEQAVSGTFSYALGSGRCIVSTSFSQAKEMIVRKNMGLLTGFRDPKGFSSAILQLLYNPRARKRMQLRAHRNTRNMLWTNCAVSFQEILMDADKSHSIAENLLPPLKLDHLKNLTDEFAMIQFSKAIKPDKSSGYTIDDNARGLLYCVDQGLENPELLALAKTYLSFIKFCQKKDGLFNNDISEDHRVLFLLNLFEVPEDANARTLWALNVLRASKDAPKSLRDEAEKMVKKFEAGGYVLKFPRARAFNLLGLTTLAKESEHPPEMLWRHIISEADFLVKLFKKNASDKWQWFEQSLTYANGILPRALLESFIVVNKSEYREIGLRSLEFLIENTFRGGVYVPIGQHGWYTRNKRRAEFDQQPEDPSAMMYALDSAYRVTGDKRYLDLAKRAFFWFLGDNMLGASVYDRSNGGTYDGITKKGVNLNQGAESTLSYLTSRFLLENLLNESSKDSGDDV